MAQKMQYKVITAGTKELEAQLNALSSDGWRPITMGVVPMGGGVTGKAVVILERGV
jgi:hypothetical protein